MDVKPVVVQKWAMARDDPYFRLRIPEGLLLKVQAAAGENHRSVTAEMLARLEASFPEDAVDLSIAEMVSAIHEHARRLAKAEEKIGDLENQVVDLRVRAGTLDYAGNED